MTRAWFLIIAFSLVSLSLRAAPLRTGGVFFLPNTSYVGDLVEMKVPLLEVPNSFQFHWEADEASLSTFLEIREVTYDERTAIVAIYFVPYSAGRQAFPVIKVGEKATLEGLSITTSSLLDETTRVAPFKKPLLVAGTEILFFLIILLLLALPLGAIQGITRLRAWIKYQRESYLYRKPYRQFLVEMESLHKLILEPSAYHFFLRLDQVLRTFLSYRLGENFTTYTTKEMKIYLRDKAIFSFQESETLIDLFRMTDLVKFADYQINIQVREVFWQDTMALIEKFERERSSHVNV